MLRTLIRALTPLLLLLASTPVRAGDPAPADSTQTPAAAAQAPPVAPTPAASQAQAPPAAPAEHPHAAVPVTTLLQDATRVTHWTLANGLRVVTRHLPGAHSAAVTLCYRMGSQDDPVEREGRAELVGQAGFTGRCGDVPERSMMELDQLRPGGWSLQVGPHLTEFTEACPTALLPGVLHQVCQRLHGIGVNDTLLERSRTEVRRRLRRNYDTQPEKTLYFLSAEMAAGRTAERAIRYGTGEGLKPIGARELSTLLSERLVPSNSVLCVVGDLGGLDLKTLIERDLGRVPAGKPAPAVDWSHAMPAVVTLTRPDLREPLGLVAVIAPALTDTMHAYFTAFSVSIASHLRRSWAPPEPPLTSRFQYSISTDPELVRFYPPLTTKNLDADRTFSALLSKTSEGIVDSSSIGLAAENVAWLVGGAMPGELVKRATGDPSVIHTLATTLAGLEAFADEPFWVEYRARLARARSLDLGPFIGLFENPKRRIVLVLRPQP